jgi:hypothetical protein
MARAVLAIVSGGEDEANARVERLGEQFGEHKFGVEPHDRKHQIVLLEGPNPSTPDLDTMKSVAAGYGGSTEAREAEATPKEVKQAPLPQKGSPDTRGGAGTPPAPGPGLNPAATPRTAT